LRILYLSVYVPSANFGEAAAATTDDEVGQKLSTLTSRNTAIIAEYPFFIMTAVPPHENLSN
jgi:hypothetical protein